MLLQITNYCTEQCPHCFDDSTTDSEDHMDSGTLELALKLLVRINPRIVSITGGEVTEHPDFERMVRRVREVMPSATVTLLSNGTFLMDERKVDEVNALLRGVVDFLQVTSVPGLYRSHAEVMARAHLLGPKAVLHTDPIDVIALGRGRSCGHLSRKRPMCSNTYLVERQMRGATLAAMVAALESSNQFCKPAILCDGSVTVGETNSCRRIGTVSSSDSDLVRAISSTVPCDACGLVRNYGPERALIWGRGA